MGEESVGLFVPSLGRNEDGTGSDKHQRPNEVLPRQIAEDALIVYRYNTIYSLV